MFKFDNFGGLKSVLKFHIFMSLDESMRFCLACDDLVRFFLRCEGLVPNFTNVKNWYLIFTCVSDII